MTFVNIDSAKKVSRHGLAFAVILLAGMALYLPFIDNELIFDDISFFYRSQWLAHFAVTPFDHIPRTFPQFSFAFIHTLTQSFEIQRLVNLSLHCFNGYLLFLLSQMLLSAQQPSPTNKESTTTLIGGGIALAFVLHPVAVYGAGYLIQRTIQFATFFSLLALLQLGKAFKSESWAPLIWAAFLSVLAMFSKEVAVTLPVAAVGLLWVSSPKPSRIKYRKALAYLLICAPAMIWLAYRLKSHVATPYEIHAPVYLQGVQEATDSLWLRSALAECGLYFKYLRLWLLPDTALMSIDLRMPFPETWSSAMALLGGSAFLLAFAGGSYLLLCSKGYCLLGLGLIYTQVLFLVELSTIRVQEPFVLYRSYLWGPGFLLMSVCLLQHLSQRAVCLVFTLILPILAYQAVDRLTSLSTGMNAWADAQAKLSSDALPGAFRIYHNRGVQYLGAKQHDLALTDFVTCNRLNPAFAGCLSGQAVVLSREKNYEPALVAINSALKISPDNPGHWESKGNVLKALGHHAQAEAAFAEAEARGGSISTILRRGKLGNLTSPPPAQNPPQE